MVVLVWLILQLTVIGVARREQCVPYSVVFWQEGRKEILLVRATTKVDWHVNVWSEQISGPQIYQGKQ